jgi:hypothetical protein
MRLLQRPGREATLVRLEGALDASADVRALAQTLAPGPGLFDLGEVTACDQAGFDVWRDLVAMAPQAERAIVRCPEPFLHQLEHTGVAGAAARIISVKATAVCGWPGCAGEVPLLIDLRLHRELLLARKLPCPPCPVCGNETQLPSTAGAYGCVLEDPTPTLTPRLSALLDLFPAHHTATRSGFETVLEQAGGVTALWVRGPLIASAGLGPLSRLPPVPGPSMMLLRQVTGMDAGGLQALLAALAAAPPKKTVAQVPPTVLRALAGAGFDALSEAIPGGLGSAWVSAGCDTGEHLFSAELAGKALEDYCKGRAVVVPCQGCRDQAIFTRSSELVDVLTQLPFAAQAPAIEHFLGERQDGYQAPRERTTGAFAQARATRPPSSSGPRPAAQPATSARPATQAPAARSEASQARPATKPSIIPAVARPATQPPMTVRSVPKLPPRPPRPGAEPQEIVLAEAEPAPEVIADSDEFTLEPSS